MSWPHIDDAGIRRPLRKLTTRSCWAARLTFVAWVALTAFLILLLVGHLFSARSAVLASIPFAYLSALLHVISMSELGSVYWHSRKAHRTFPQYSKDMLHSRAGRGLLLGIVSQNGAFLAVPLAQFALLVPWLWLPAIGMSALSFSAARYAGRTSSLIKRFNQSDKSTGVVWL